jgi:hypothetical protein
MNRNVDAILRDIQRLAGREFELRHASDLSWIGIYGLILPQLAGGAWTSPDGQPIRHTALLIDLPRDFPRHPPGRGLSHLGHAIHAPDLHFNGRRIRDLHPCQHAPWLWLCFRELEWEAGFGLFELIRIIESSLIDRAL